MVDSHGRRAAMCMAAFVLAAGMTVVSAQSAPAFSTLTVPAASLPDGCQLTPPPPEPSPLPIVRGATVILVTGNPQDECFKAVLSYIQSLK